MTKPLPLENERQEGSMAPTRLRVLTAMLIASVTINVGLAYKLRKFNHILDPVPRTLLQLGTVVPPFEAFDLGGRLQKIGYDSDPRPTVLYVFTPPCSWCARNLDNFKTLVEKGSGQYRFITLSLSKEGLAEYVRKNELKVPVYSGLSQEAVKTYKLGSTPQTIVISPEGKVLQDWTGAYVRDQKSQVEAFFHVALPGVREQPEAKAVTN
jgi:peroxiredoxin